MKRFVWLTLLTTMLLMVGACGARQSQQSGSDAYQLDVEPATTAVGETSLAISLADSAGNPIDDATLSVKGDMTHAGMQPVLAETTGGQDGRYTVPFEWTMNGDWFLTIDVTRPDGTRFEQRFDGFSIDGEMMMEDGEGHEGHHMEEMEEGEHGDHDTHGEKESDHSHHDDHDDHVTGIVPNDGAVIRIVAPSDGQRVAAGEMVEVAVETENFDLSGEGNHWHLYLNDALVERVSDGRTTVMLHDLPAGQHTVAVAMSNGNHEELEEGAQITLEVGE